MKHAAALASPPPERQRWLMLATLCLAVLVAQIDSMIVNLAVLPIGQHFAAGMGALQWVVDSYNLVYAVLLLSGGLLADVYGRRRVFMLGAALFTLASLVCALAPTLGTLLGGRALAGLGATLMIPASLAILRVAWPQPAQRGRALGVWAACNGLALAAGPTLGGLLLRLAGWRSIFVVVIPLSVAAGVLAWLCIPESADPQGRAFDGPGQLLAAGALGSLAFAAIALHSTPRAAAAALGLGILALLGFVRVEGRRGSTALVPLDLFKRRDFVGACMATAGMTFGMYGVLFLLPLTWLSTHQLSPLGAGLALLPSALAFVLVSPLSGRLTERFSARLMGAGGLGVIAGGLLVMALSAVQASLAATELGLALTGVGMGLATGPLTATAVGAVPAARAGTASALINAARMVGATAGVALLGSVFALRAGGAVGLQQALLIGSVVQGAAAWAAWRLTRPHSAAQRAITPPQA